MTDHAGKVIGWVPVPSDHTEKALAEFEEAYARAYGPVEYVVLTPVYQPVKPAPPPVPTPYLDRLREWARGLRRRVLVILGLA